VRARIVAKRGEGWAAETESVLTHSPDRCEPVCQHAGTCGGCALQHWRPEPYLAWKSGLLEAGLRRAGFAPALAPITGTPPGARRRMDLAIRRRGTDIVIGLHAHRGAEVIDIQECPVLDPALFALVAPLRQLLRGLPMIRREGSAVANLTEGGPDLLLRTDAAPDSVARTKLAAFAAAHGLPRITHALGRGTPEIVAGLRPAMVHLSGVAVLPPPGAFLQASPTGEAAIVAAVLAGLPDRLPARARIAELHAGMGTLTFALARRARVAAFEGDEATAAALKAAVNAAQLAGRVDVQRRDLARQPLSIKDLAPFAATVLDPPHAGAPEQCALLAGSAVPRIIYVSCNPATLSRDAAVLRQGGYRLLAATPIDQFVWSARLESISVFSR
jgi:23S rRNA (uracil1939-C5)-methyltransferase